ncbi:uncharacterized protein LOC111703304 isoform X2 [Eurytemora carolleeae]|uniref:uncharacterized protein LOC111703304 isoform X2 n=1 Tax=Eurytemora carolleeae TaxID=1294199 RepID=UPI000C77CB8C|nr:uncharacterized protein LOC111703304 isoform X2 [Eurytemora carolleeae]|eukprot:XP_023330970.1 uncharacterized protein LOC111703304 isoform X2 [Eurytemora affinis]
MEVHAHCETCLSMHCNEETLCKVVVCLNNCGMRLHSCKMTDHIQEICNDARVPCLNNQYGCKYKLRRFELKEHLQRCPASTVECGFVWNRLPLYLARFTELQGCAEGQLDYEIALRDQRAEQTLALVPRRAKVQLRNFLTKRFPVVPVPRSSRRTGYKGDKSVPDKVYIVDAEGELGADFKSYRKQHAHQEEAWREDLKERVGKTSIPRYWEVPETRKGGVHNHCSTCILSNCTLGRHFDPSLWRESCPQVDCRWRCGARYHSCKTGEHRLLCKGYIEEDEFDWIKRLEETQPIEEGSQDTVSSLKDISQNRVQVEDKLSTDCLQSPPPPPQPLPYHATGHPALYLNLQVEHIHRMHVKPVQMRNFICGGVFRRDEIADHTINIHQQIQCGLESRWLMGRCPTQFLGYNF